MYFGPEVIQEYASDPNWPCGTELPLAREIVWGDPEQYPEVVPMITHHLDPVQTENYHYLHDVLGSVIGLVDDSGELVERYTYDPYGKVFIEKWDAAANGGNGAWAASETDCGSSTCGKLTVSLIGNPFLWIGHRYDAAVGLYATLYRTYSPTLGRWLQRDPIEYDGGSINLYEYVASAPLFWVDPLGLYELNDEERKLADQTSYWEQLGVKNAKDAAEEALLGPEYDRRTRNGPGDAVRHCVWNCEMSLRNGKESAEKWANAHEPKQCDAKHPQDEKDMDLHNNDVGRDVSEETDQPDDSSENNEDVTSDLPLKLNFKDKFEMALKNGSLKLLPEGRWGNRRPTPKD